MKDGDIGLLRRLQVGDASAFEIIYNQMAPRWISFFKNARRYGLTQTEAEDVVQDTMLAIFAKVSTFDPAGKASFSTWCYKIAIFKAIEIYRKREKLEPIDETDEVELLSHQPLDEEPNDQSDTGPEDGELENWIQGDSEILRALRSLKKQEQYILLSKALRGLTHKQIADKLGKSEDTVRVQFHRAKNKLKPLLEGLRKTDEPKGHS